MSLSDIVSVTVNVATASIDRAAFNVPLLCSYHTRWVQRVRTYTKLADMISDGFTSTDQAYLMAAAMKAQNPSLNLWKIGRRASAPVPTYGLTVTSSTEGQTLSLTIEGTDISYTIPAAQTTTQVATAIELLIEAVTGVNSSSSSAVITIVPASTNDILSIGNVSSGLTLKDNTPDPGLAADLDAIYAADPDWYVLLIDSESEANINVAAAWVQTNGEKLLIAGCNDSEIMDSGVTTDVASDQETQSRDRTAILYTNISGDYGSAAWVGRMLPYDPGKASWAFKKLSNVTVSTLTGAQQTAIGNKSANFYVTIKGQNITRWGTVGTGEYLDVMQFVDWLKARTEERFLSIFVKNAKLAYSNETADMFRAALLAQFAEGVELGGLLPDTEDTPHVVNIPDVADVDEADKVARLLPDIVASAYLAGAVHKTQIEINLSL